MIGQRQGPCRMPLLVDQLYPYLFLRSKGAAFIEIIANEDDVAVGVEFSNRQQFLSTHILINSSVQISETALLNCRSPRKYRSAK